MAFKKEVIIYESKSIKVFINQCHAKGIKTRIFAVRRNDKKGLGHYLGSISWSGSWRQYIFGPSSFTYWSHGCMQGIVDFLKKINLEHRKKLRCRNELRKR